MEWSSGLVGLSSILDVSPWITLFSEILTSHLVYVWVWQKYADAQNISILAAITEIRYIKKNTKSSQKTVKSGQTLIMLRS